MIMLLSRTPYSQLFHDVMSMNWEVAMFLAKPKQRFEAVLLWPFMGIQLSQTWFGEPPHPSPHPAMVLLKHPPIDHGLVGDK